MRKAAQAVAADLAATAVRVEEHELSFDAPVDGNDQTISTDPRGAIAPTLGQLASIVGHLWLKPDKEVIAEAVQLVQIVALHARCDFVLGHVRSLAADRHNERPSSPSGSHPDRATRCGGLAGTTAADVGRIGESSFGQARAHRQA